MDEVFNNAIDALSDEDKKLPQVEHVLPLLRKGIGIHHGGLLPLLKETIEILFSEGLIKVRIAILQDLNWCILFQNHYLCVENMKEGIPFLAAELKLNYFWQIGE